MGPFYTNTEGAIVYNAGVSTYRKLKNDAFFLVMTSTAYVGPAQFEVWVAPRDTTQPEGVCIADLTKARKVQFKANVCPWYTENEAGDLILKFAATTGLPAADEIVIGADSCANVRIPMCDTEEFIMMKIVTVTPGITGVLITNKAVR